MTDDRGQMTDDRGRRTDDVAGPVMLNGAAVRFKSGGFDFRVKTSLFSQTSGTFASCFGFRGEDVKARAELAEVA